MADITPDQNTTYLKQLRTLLTCILILGVIGTLYLARDFFLPVIFAFFIALTFRPTVRRLAHHNIPPWATASAFATILLLICVLAGYLLSGPLAGWIENAPQNQRILEEKIRDISASIQDLVNMTIKIQDAAMPDNGAQVQEVVIKQDPSTMLSLAALYPANFIFLLSGALVIAVFLMASGDLFYEKLVRVLPTLSDKKTALRIVFDVEREVSAYLISTTVINIGVGVAVAASFYFLNMPTPFLWGFLAFVFNYIPYIGPIAGTFLAALASIIIFDSFSAAIMPPLVYLVFIGIETQFVSPAFLSRRLKLNPVAILLALAFWAWVWGIPGVVVAVPLLVTLSVFCSHLESLSNIGEFLTASSKERQSAEQMNVSPKTIATSEIEIPEAERAGAGR